MSLTLSKNRIEELRVELIEEIAKVSETPSDSHANRVHKTVEEFLKKVEAEDKKKRAEILCVIGE